MPSNFVNGHMSTCCVRLLYNYQSSVSQDIVLMLLQGLLVAAFVKPTPLYIRCLKGSKSSLNASNDYFSLTIVL